MKRAALYFVFQLFCTVLTAAQCPEFVIDFGEDLNLYFSQNKVPNGPFLPFSLEELEAIDFPRTYRHSILGNFTGYLGKVVSLGTTSPFLVRRQAGEKIEASDLVGRIVQFKKVRSIRAALGGSPTFKQSTEPLFEPENWSDADPPRDFQLPSDLRVLAQELALRHTSGSTSFAAAATREREELASASADVNLDMLRLLQSGKPLTLERISRWNQRLLSAQNADDRIELIDGILRGTVIQTQTTEGLAELDLRTLNVPMQCATNQQVFAQRPGSVPDAMSLLVAEINSWNRDTEFSKPGLVARRFIRTHPYYDGSGRTGRVLADYALMKAGFAPAPQELSRRKFVLYVSDSDALKILRGAYAGTLPPAPHWSLQPGN